MEEWSPFRAYASSPGRGRRHWVSVPDMLVMAILLVGCCWCFLAARHLAQYDWQWPLLADFLWRRNNADEFKPGLLLLGLFTTLRVGFWTVIFALAAGGALGIATARKSLWLSWPLVMLINLLRNTPPLVLLFFVYFFAGSFLPVNDLENFIRGLGPAWQEWIAILVAQPGQMDRMLAAVLALGLYQAAYIAEIVRGGIEAVNTGQWDAAYSLGFGKLAALSLVILPQAMRLILPALTGQIISVFKDSALASLISLPDLTFQSLEIMAVSSMTFEVWITAAILYLLLGLVCAAIGRILEKRTNFNLVQKRSSWQ